MTKDEIIKKRYPFYNSDIANKDIEVYLAEVKELMDLYLIDQLKGLIEDLSIINSEDIIERIKSEIVDLEQRLTTNK